MAHAIGLEVHRSHSTGFFRNLLEERTTKYGAVKGKRVGGQAG